MSAQLTPDELHQLTGRKRWSAQARALASAQIAVVTTTAKQRCDSRQLRPSAPAAHHAPAA